MVWWEVFEDPDLSTTSGVLTFAAVATGIILVGGLVLAYAYSWYEARRKSRRADANAADAARKP